MTTLHFQPATSGGWLAIVSDARLLVLAEEPRDGFVDEAWAAIRQSEALQAMLDLLTRSGLSATPSFAIAEWNDAGTARVIVRGAVELEISDAQGQSVVSGAGVSTWTERALTGVTAISLNVADAASASSPGMLPLASGGALVAAVRIAVGKDAAESPAPTPVAKKPAAEKPPVEKPPVVAPAAISTREPEVDPEATVTEAPTISRPLGNEAATSGYDDLFGATVYRPIPDAAPQGPTAVPAPVDTSPGENTGDHDGETVLTSDIAKLRGSTPRPLLSAAPSPEAAPTLVLLLPSGDREPLDRPVLVGRSPSVSKISGGDLPRLVTLDGGDQDISRNHAKIVLEGDTVVVTDLHSRNGTLVVLPGKSPQKLRAGEPTAIIVGTVIDFGGGLTITVETIPAEKALETAAKQVERA